MRAITDNVSRGRWHLFAYFSEQLDNLRSGTRMVAVAQDGVICVPFETSETKPKGTFCKQCLSRWR